MRTESSVQVGQMLDDAVDRRAHDYLDINDGMVSNKGAGGMCELGIGGLNAHAGGLTLMCVAYTRVSCTGMSWPRR